MYNLVNKAGIDASQYETVFDQYFPYTKDKLGYDKDFTVVLASNPDNAKMFWAGTAHYNPSTHEITVYIDGRHPKDILRSISHELVHHAQNCRGEFDREMSTEEGYAQNDPHLSKMEDEAYLVGNRLLRDYEDGMKTKNERIFETLIKRFTRR